MNDGQIDAEMRAQVREHGEQLAALTKTVEHTREAVETNGARIDAHANKVEDAVVGMTAQISALVTQMALANESQEHDRKASRDHRRDQGEKLACLEGEFRKRQPVIDILIAEHQRREADRADRRREFWRWVVPSVLGLAMLGSGWVGTMAWREAMRTAAIPMRDHELRPHERDH